jgi:hypothetical protein
MNTELAAGLGGDVLVLLRLLCRYKGVNKYDAKGTYNMFFGSGCKKIARLYPLRSTASG